MVVCLVFKLECDLSVGNQQKHYRRALVSITPIKPTSHTPLFPAPSLAIYGDPTAHGNRGPTRDVTHRPTVPANQRSPLGGEPGAAGTAAKSGGQPGRLAAALPGRRSSLAGARAESGATFYDSGQPVQHCSVVICRPGLARVTGRGPPGRRWTQRPELSSGESRAVSGIG